MNIKSLHNKYTVIFILIFSVLRVSAATSYYFNIIFTDKNNSPFSLNTPNEFLSQRALDRRTEFGIVIDSLDLPVNPTYIAELESNGFHVHCKSKWLNSVTVLISDSGSISQVSAFPFVRNIQYTGKIDQAQLVKPNKVKAADVDIYGTAINQIKQISGISLHNEGFRGKGIQIAVLDAGFRNVDINPAFDSLRLQGRLLGVKDMIEPNSNIYSQDSHGANVLSIMTGNLPGQYLGTAPDASFWLIRTEYAPTEYIVETDFWVSGIEYADSVGADVVNSSLGYYTFDDTSTSFSYNDMTGKVSRASIAAGMASKKGMLVVVSAGNEGNKDWHYIGSPADADGILAVGAVQTDSLSSSFSSFGPSFDKRVKPEICALGTATALVNTNGDPVNGNGTSYSSPVIAGMMACLLQRYKLMDAHPVIQVLLQSVVSSASLYNNPTAQMGYGIPDFWQAEQNLPIYDSLKKTDANNLRITYNKLYRTLTIMINNQSESMSRIIAMYSVTGEKKFQMSAPDSVVRLNMDKFAAGIYCLTITENGKSISQKILIH